MTTKTSSIRMTFVLLATAGCGANGHRPAAAPQRTSTSAPPAEPAGLTLLEAGAEPREVVRYDLAAAKHASFRILAHEAFHGGDLVPATELPDLQIDGDVSTTSVSRGGVAALAVHGAHLEGRDRPGESLPAIELTKRIDGWSFTARTSLAPDGMRAPLVLDSDGPRPPVVDDLPAELAQLTVRFPSAAVGVGARWRVVTPVDLRGVRATRTASYELTARQGSSVSLRRTVAITAPAQEFQMPGLPGTTRLDELHGAGTATLTVDTASPVATVTSDLRVDEKLHIADTPLSVDTHVEMAPR